MIKLNVITDIKQNYKHRDKLDDQVNYLLQYKCGEKLKIPLYSLTDRLITDIFDKIIEDYEID